MNTKHAYYKIVLTAVLIIFFLSGSIAQDTTKTEEPKSKKHSPQLAWIMSSIVPGSGQVYNKQIWKVPIVYGGFAALTYSYIESTKNYNTYKDAYLLLKDTDSTIVINGIPETAAGAEVQKEQYRSNRDLTIIGFAIVYFLNIIDAHVYAHFFDYDVSDDLTINVKPDIISANPKYTAFGVKLKFKF